MCQKNIFGFQIAMNNLLRLQQEQTAKNLFRESSNHFEIRSPESVGLDKFVKVHVEELGGNAKMPSEVEALGKVDHAVFVMWILFYG